MQDELNSLGDGFTQSTLAIHESKVTHASAAAVICHVAPAPRRMQLQKIISKNISAFLRPLPGWRGQQWPLTGLSMVGGGGAGYFGKTTKTNHFLTFTRGSFNKF